MGKRLEELLRQRTLLGPFGGVVNVVEQHPGELAQTGEGARPILKMAQIHPLRVEVVLPVALYNQVRTGTAADIEAEAPTKGRYKATFHIRPSARSSIRPAAPSACVWNCPILRATCRPAPSARCVFANAS